MCREGGEMRVVALIKRIIQEIFRDKRTLALLFIAPLFILSLMYFLFNGETEDPTLGVIHLDSDIISKLEDANITIKQFETTGDTKELVIDNNLDGLLQIKNEEEVLLTLENNDPTSAKALEMKINQVVISHLQAEFFSQIAENVPNIVKPEFGKESIKTTFVYGNSGTVFFDVLSPILVGYFVFFFTFLISGIGLLKERTSGTLERLMVTPIRRGEIVTAYVAGYGIFAVIQTIIVVLFAVYVLDVGLVGSIWSVFFINILLALVALSLGTLLSSFAASEFQMIQFIPIVVIPQIFFSGMIPIDGMATWLQWIAKTMPFYYAANGLKEVMYKGVDLADIGWDLAALGAFAIVFIYLNMLALKKHRAL